MNVNIVDYQLWLVDGDRKYGYRGLLKGFRAQISFRPPFLFVLRRCHLPIIVGTIRTKVIRLFNLHGKRLSTHRQTIHNNYWDDHIHKI